ncbi:MAG TPA: sulfite exporter TauE/SafE family protein [Ilumatobacteraceae bacterium]|nr:sulfite exporter TauE/SafE family protein [Ilumatobacteraceae bacterium]
MFTAGNLILGCIAALIVGLSKTAFPGAALIATPIIATIVSGRLIAGTTLPILFAGDIVAVIWYGHHTRWDHLKPMIIPVGVGFAAGAIFFAVVGSSTRPMEIVIGLCILVIALMQAWRMSHRIQPVPPTAWTAAAYGSSGGFTTFVASAAGPILNTYFIRLGLNKDELVGTSAWFYFAVNGAKFPIYIALGLWTDGGPFFTGTTLLFDLLMFPALLIGLLGGRRLLHVLSEKAFLTAVLVLSTAGAIKLLWP